MTSLLTARYDAAGTQIMDPNAVANFAAGPLAQNTGSAQIINVTMGGNDSTGRRGSASNPFRTLRAASVCAGITSGDVIVIGPGTFDETGTGNGIVIPAGVNLRGAGMNQTIIDLYDVDGSANKVCLVHGTNSDNSDYTIRGKQVYSVTGNFLIGITAIVLWPSLASTIHYRRIKFQAYSDNIFINSSTLFYRQNWKFYDCEFISGYDLVLMTGGNSFADAILDFFNCSFTATWDGVDTTAQSRLFTGPGDRYLTNFWNCKVKLYSRGAIGGALVDFGSAVPSYPASAAFYNCDVSDITTSTAANNYLLKLGSSNANGAVFMSGCRLPTVTYVNILGGSAVVSGSMQLGNTAPVFQSQQTLANGAGASAGTLANAPVVGNPTKWLAINDAGTTRYIPAW